MAVFSDYARYYNLLYRDKDYCSETAFVLEVLKKHGCNPQTLLDLGCGTGRHALEMAKRGVQVTGVDISETMLDMGRQMLEGLNAADFSAPLPVLLHGDARSVRVNQKYDAVVSLFHVMSYQNTGEDILAVMRTAKEHLHSGGLYLFDFWYGPAVLSDPPSVRIKRFEDDYVQITRITEPQIQHNKNIVDVNFEVIIEDKKAHMLKKLQETHTMRYLFLPEIIHLAAEAGLLFVADYTWLNFNPVSEKSWYGLIVLRKK